MAKSMQSPRLPKLTEASLTAEQKALAESIKSGPRGQFKMSGPFAIYLHSPAFGELAQQLGGHLRFKTSVPPRLMEFAILVTASHWKAQYEWAMHAPMAEKQGVKPQTVRDLQAGRAAQIGAARRDGDLCLRQGALRETARQQAGLQSRVQAARRSRHRRAGRHPRLLRHGVDDAQHFHGAAARGHQSAVQGAGEVISFAHCRDSDEFRRDKPGPLAMLRERAARSKKANYYATRPIGLPPDCMASLGEAPRADGFVHALLQQLEKAVLRHGRRRSARPGRNRSP